MGNLVNGTEGVFSVEQEARIREIIQEVVGARTRPVTINIEKMIETQNVSIEDSEEKIVEVLARIIQTATFLAKPEIPPVYEEDIIREMMG